MNLKNFTSFETFCEDINYPVKEVELRLSLEEALEILEAYYTSPLLPLHRKKRITQKLCNEFNMLPPPYTKEAQEKHKKRLYENFKEWQKIKGFKK